ncbi:MAG: hypothetical protein R2747_22840 [Pyrinomonadaceae bacterium]
MKIESGETVIIVLQNPREKLFGILHEITPSGVFLRGIDLNYFDEWIKAIKNEEPYLPMQDAFYPMWRVERMTRDESAEGLPSLGEQFEQRTGFKPGDF